MAGSCVIITNSALAEARVVTWAELGKIRNFNIDTDVSKLKKKTVEVCTSFTHTAIRPTLCFTKKVLLDIYMYFMIVIHSHRRYFNGVLTSFR